MVNKYDNITGVMAYHERKGEHAKAREGLTFTLRPQTQISNFGQLLFLPPYLLIGTVIFWIFTKDLAYGK